MPHYRKLQKIGGSSYFITLPKSWVQKNSLDKNAIISLTESATGDLIVTPQNFTESVRTANLTLNKTNYDVMVRMAASAYINGCTEMTISSPDKQSLKNIEKYIQSRFPGFILTREGDDFFSMKFVVDLTSVNFMELFERMDRLTSFMCDEIADAGALKDYDIEVDSLYFLLIRILRTAIMDSSLVKVIGLTPVQILDFRLVLHALERFGDELVVLSGRPVEQSMQKIKELKEGAIKAFNGNPGIVPSKIEDLKADAYSSLDAADHDSKPHLWRLIELASDIADLSETLYKFNV
ncbi:MAG: phosphate uptake regulator PhoU [Nitrososphaerota archaeon]|jgi:phosphate uptake regulator|nr:phosphate uptake regulator PhoU [Nitrososphaerota archaeon]MDG6927144.1 phosphate uptake regulator PhoU [Nitrososphaerota archaeon]MDG6931172.1 phosphate uptake regulator PhoU [Nitrososphaerota archaeon]MDG6932312.1 phosphate uptake regulator PhoU [Nitrososphaerota archaeon]MDG6936488.1 phosphate uptake regulator PhoU [Nitrososphaerota archaeon]